jgi:phosphatidylglycerol:prolipoprotein diacylglycerol transferase
MRPVLFEVGPFEVHSWGVMVALALVLAGAILRRELDRLVGRGDVATSLVIAAGVGGIVGARLYWPAEHAGEASVVDSLSGAGFTWYGGVLGGAAAVLLIACRRGVPFDALLGAAAPALALGYGVGRIACQLAGDGTYGIASDLPWAMSYPHGEVPTTERVHPTPVYETFVSLLIFWLLWRSRRHWPPLRLFGTYLLLAGAERLLVEFLRRNDEVIAGLTQPQLFSLAMIASGALLLAVAPRLARRRPAGAPRPSGTPASEGAR